MITGKIVYGTDIDLSKFDWSEVDIKMFQEKLDDIMGLLHKSIDQENFQELFDHCYYLIDKIPLPLITVDTNFIVRARANYNGEVFKEEWEISYNSRNTDKIQLSRFNRPGESMFYGSVPASEKQGRLIGTVSLECCKDLVDDKTVSREQYFTFGKWAVKEPVVVLNLCFNDKVLAVNQHLRKMVDQYMKEVENRMPAGSGDFIRNYWRFFSGLACAKHERDQQYFITTAYMCAVREYYKDGFNGIVYPSSMTENEGVNIVLTPKAVDCYINLTHAFMYKYTRDPDNPKSYHSGICSQIADVENGQFRILGIR